MTITTWQDHKDYLRLSFPLVISTLSAPMTGVIDTAIMGRLPDAVYIAGVSISVLIFNTVYWLLGFLRVSTSGFSAQAQGDPNPNALSLALLRPMLIAIFIGLSLILLQYPIKYVSFLILSPEQNIKAIASQYFDIRIWSAPFTLINYVVTGWLLGMGKVKLALLLQVFMNLLNAVMSYIFVMQLNMQADGVAWAALLSEIITVILSIAIFFKVKLMRTLDISYKKICDLQEFASMMRMNRDLFIRTFCLLAVFNLFGVYGLRYGETILAANAVLMQIHFVMAHILGGLGNTNTVFVGRAFGSKNANLYFKTMKISFIWSALSCFAMALVLVCFDRQIVGFFTNLQDVVQIALNYYYWLLLFPFVTFAGLLLYGSFVGSTDGVPIRNSLLLSLALFLVCLFTTESTYNNHGLWFAFIMFSFGRTIFLLPYWPRQNKLFRGFEKN